jgi:hypothetical protein
MEPFSLVHVSGRGGEETQNKRIELPRLTDTCCGVMEIFGGTKKREMKFNGKKWDGMEMK